MADHAKVREALVDALCAAGMTSIGDGQRAWTRLAHALKVETSEDIADTLLSRAPVPPAPEEERPFGKMATEVNVINRANGWEVLTPDDWCDHRKVITLLALVTTEVAEAIEAVRNDDRENFAEEIADTVIRCLDIAGGLGVDLDGEVAAKLSKNRQRGHKHGGKRV